MSSSAHPHIPALPAIQALAAADMAAVDALIRHRLASDVVLINQIAEHIIAAGGKRLRPMLLLLAARALGHQGADAHQLAAVIEFIHTSTLLHDDVVDESDLRRGRKTANALWGNAASVLVGDFLYSRSFQMMVELDSHGGDADPRRHHQPDRRRRGAAAAARAQPRYRRSRLPARDRAQDRGAVRRRDPARRAAGRRRRGHAADACTTTA